MPSDKKKKNKILARTVSGLVAAAAIRQRRGYAAARIPTGYHGRLHKKNNNNSNSNKRARRA